MSSPVLRTSPTSTTTASLVEVPIIGIVSSCTDEDSTTTTTFNEMIEKEEDNANELGLLDLNHLRLRLAAPTPTNTPIHYRSAKITFSSANSLRRMSNTTLSFDNNTDYSSSSINLSQQEPSYDNVLITTPRKVNNQKELEECLNEEEQVEEHDNCTNEEQVTHNALNSLGDDGKTEEEYNNNNVNEEEYHNNEEYYDINSKITNYSNSTIIGGLTKKELELKIEEKLNKLKITPKKNFRQPFKSTPKKHIKEVNDGKHLKSTQLFKNQTSIRYRSIADETYVKALDFLNSVNFGEFDEERRLAIERLKSLEECDLTKEYENYCLNYNFNNSYEKNKLKKKNIKPKYLEVPKKVNNSTNNGNIVSVHPTVFMKPLDLSLTKKKNEELKANSKYLEFLKSPRSGKTPREEIEEKKELIKSKRIEYKQKNSQTTPKSQKKKNNEKKVGNEVKNEEELDLMDRMTKGKDEATAVEKVLTFNNDNEFNVVDEPIVEIIEQQEENDGNEQQHFEELKKEEHEDLLEMEKDVQQDDDFKGKEEENEITIKLEESKENNSEEENNTNEEELVRNDNNTSGLLQELSSIMEEQEQEEELSLPLAVNVNSFVEEVREERQPPQHEESKEEYELCPPVEEAVECNNKNEGKVIGEESSETIMEQNSVHEEKEHHQHVENSNTNNNSKKKNKNKNKNAKKKRQILKIN
ncbi:hypothetical protein ABK040_005193 [Willaertia magna]